MASETSKFGSLTIPELREELRTRGAKLSGRKKELVDRLDAYERNFNFGKVPVTNSLPEYNMKTPDEITYKDLHRDIPIPHVNMESIECYLEPLNKTMGPESINLVNEKFLRYVKTSQLGDLCFFKSQCWAEMRKSVKYNVDISIDSNGLVSECQCDCGSGMGPEAHCKHVNALLYVLFKFCANGELITEETCTQKLQTFHHVKKHQGSPIKSCNLRLSQNKRKCDLNFDPRPPKYRKMASYPANFRNICLNFGDVGSLPISQLFPPANTYAVAKDHDYLEESPEERFLGHLELSTISEESIANIEKKTRKQSCCKEWMEMRTLRLNSSNFGRICKLTDRTDKHKYAKELTQHKNITSNAVKHGKKYEKLAITTFAEQSTLTVKKCGTMVCKEMPFIGSSPDGLVGNDATLEVKCPFVSKDKMVNERTVPYLIQGDSGTLTLRKTHDYYYQVQGQLLCSGREMCYFCVFTLKDFKIIKIQKDVEFIEHMCVKLKSFYETYFKEAVLEKFFFRNYGNHNFS